MVITKDKYNKKSVIRSRHSLLYFPMLHIFMLKVNESKSAIMDTTNPLFIQSFIFTKKVLSDEGIKYFTKIFDELREMGRS